MMNMHPWLEEFLTSVLDTSVPPSVPFKSADWAGFSFDRNRHEDLAPDYIWMSWLEVQRAIEGQALIVYSRPTSRSSLKSLLVEPSLEGLRSYWSTDDQFLSDHFIVDPSRRWVV